MNLSLNKEYFDHKVFKQLKEYARFYKLLSYSVMGFSTLGIKGLGINIDTHVFSSIQGTLESIKYILSKGRINDSFALLRKYYDSTIINVYSNLYLSDHFDIKNFVVTQIDDWVKGKDTIPEYRRISQYIKESP